MFTLIKMILGLAGAAVVAAVIAYFLPADLKTKTLSYVAGIVPDALEAKAEEFLLTPPEQREKLIAKVEANVAALKVLGEPKAQELAAQTETLLAQLKDKNGELSLTEIVKEKLVDQFLGTSASSTCPLVN